jgi:hypothetical protein
MVFFCSGIYLRTDLPAGWQFLNRERERERERERDREDNTPLHSSDREYFSSCMMSTSAGTVAHGSYLAAAFIRLVFKP